MESETYASQRQAVLDAPTGSVIVSRVEEGGSSKESLRDRSFRKGAKRAEAVGRWRASRKLARKLLDQLVQFDVDAARETCYSVVMQLDALQRGARDGS